MVRFYRVVNVTHGWVVELFDMRREFLRTFGNGEVYTTKLDANIAVSTTYPFAEEMVYAG